MTAVQQVEKAGQARVGEFEDHRPAWIRPDLETVRITPQPANGRQQGRASGWSATHGA
jgi:hypothetical protein